MADAAFRNLAVWQRAMDLAVACYRLTANLKAADCYSLGDQLKRSSSSVPANIAEGRGRGTDRDFARFLHIARGSLHETETHLELVERLGLASADVVAPLRNEIQEIGRMLNGLLRSLLKTSSG